MWFDVVLWRVPELLPAFAETLVMHTSKSKSVRDNKFIEDLYREVIMFAIERVRAD